MSARGSSPPRLPGWLAGRLLPFRAARRLLGDLDEEYTDYQLGRRGRLRADLWYWRQTLLSIVSLRHDAEASAPRYRRVGKGGPAWMGSVGSDVRYAFRQLWRNPVFTVAAVLTFALGIGATTSIFSVVNTVLLESLPYDQPEKVVRAWAHSDDGDTRDFSFRVVEYRDLSTHTDVFEAVGAEFPASFTMLFADQEPQHVQARMITADFFRVFGTGPFLGGMFTRDQITAGDALVAVVTYDFWARSLGADPAAVGSALNIEGNSFTLVGVLPADYRHISGDDVEVFIPFTIGTSRWTAHWLDLYGRLQPGVSITRAEQEVNAVLDAVAEADRRSAGWHATVEGLHAMVVGDVRPALWAIFGTVGIVLLIACVNVANLVLVRASTRASELMVRKALGAGRGRIVRQLLIENMTVATLGGLVGVGAAFWGVRGIAALAPASIPRVAEAQVDLNALAFSVALTFATGLLFGLIPALRVSRSDSTSVPGRRHSGGTGGSAVGGLFGGLIVSQVALSLTLLVSAGLMIRTFQRLQEQDLGFQRSSALAFRVIAPSSRYPTAIDTNAFYDSLREGLGALPGVTAVGASTDLPVSGEGAVATVNSEERVRAGATEGVTTLQRRATAGFFKALGTPLVAGRPFGPEDRRGSEATVIISESLARLLFPDGTAAGRRMGFGRAPGEEDWMTVVGVVADVRYQRADMPEEPQLYQAHPQSTVRDMAVVVRTTGSPDQLLEGAREVLRSLDAEIPMFSVTTLQGLVDDALAGRRFTMSVLSLFAALAVALTLAGIYGVLAFVVIQRRREIGVRMALGARAEDITWLVVGQGMRAVTLGLVLGLGGAFAVARLMRGLLYGVSSTDVVTHVWVVTLMLAVAAVACYLPARRASGVDPVAVLREE